MIVGAKVEQRIVLQECEGDEPETKVALAGTVVACERAGAPAEYHALVMREDGTLTEVLARLLTVVELPSGAQLKIKRPKAA